MHADVSVDDPVIIDVDLPIVVEIAIEPHIRAEVYVPVDTTVVVDVELSVEVRVPAVGELDQDARPVDGLPVPQRGVRALDADNRADAAGGG